jgi:DNA repair protein RAD50
LKYAITGSFPPGCGRSGNAFVHDPKSIVQTTVKANVKLRFTSRAGQSMVVTRSMELTQKKTTQTFKQLDGVLRMTDPITGGKVSLSHKCTELDKQIPHLLGVSKPILEHVVFCHQEDASWPLMEGAILKKRFDDIFDSTKYSKALQAFRVVEKDFLSKVKDLKVEVATYNAHKQAADAFRKELIEQQEHIDSLGDAKDEVEQQIVKVEANMQHLQEIMNAIEDIDMQIEVRKNELTQEKVVITKQRSMLEEDLTRKHSLNELKSTLRDFHEKMNVQATEQQILKDQVDRLNREIEQARQDEIALTSNMGKLMAEKEAHEKRLQQRYRKMEHIAQAYSMDLTQVTLSQGNASFLSQTQGDGDDDNETLATLVSISPEDMQCFFQALSTKQTELLENLNESKARYRAEEDKIQAHLTELGGKLQAIENGSLKSLIKFPISIYL